MARKNELVLTAIALVQIGERLEKSREKLRMMVAQGVSYESEEMKEALQDFLRLEQQWKALEEEYLRLKGEML